MKAKSLVITIVLAASLPAAPKPMHVVTTLPDYADLTKAIGGDRVTVESIVHPIQDPHHIRPKPSFVHMVKEADLIIATGLDLELWLPTVVNKSGPGTTQLGSSASSRSLR